MFIRVCLCLPLFTCACLPMLTHVTLVYLCLHMFNYVYLCLLMFTYVDLCLPIICNKFHIFSIFHGIKYIDGAGKTRLRKGRRHGAQNQFSGMVCRELVSFYILMFCMIVF